MNNFDDDSSLFLIYVNKKYPESMSKFSRMNDDVT